MSYSTDSTHKISQALTPSTPWGSEASVTKHLISNPRYIYSISFTKHSFSAFLKSIFKPLSAPNPEDTTLPTTYPPHQTTPESYTVKFSIDIDELQTTTESALSDLYPNNYNNIDSTFTNTDELWKKNLNVIKDILSLHEYPPKYYLGTSIYEYLIFKPHTPELQCLKGIGSFPWITPTLIKEGNDKWLFCTPNKPYPPFKLPMNPEILSIKSTSINPKTNIYTLTVDINDFFYYCGDINNPNLKSYFIKSDTNSASYEFMSGLFNSNHAFVKSCNLHDIDYYKKDLWKEGNHQQNYYLYPEHIESNIWNIEPVTSQPPMKHVAILRAEYSKTKFKEALPTQSQLPYPNNNNQSPSALLQLPTLTKSNQSEKIYELINNSFNFVTQSKNNSNLFNIDSLLPDKQNINFINNINYITQSIQSNPQPSILNHQKQHTLIPSPFYDYSNTSPNTIEISFKATKNSSMINIRLGTYYLSAQSTNYNINSTVSIFESTTIAECHPDVFKNFSFKNIDLIITNDKSKAITVLRSLRRHGIKHPNQITTALVTKTEHRGGKSDSDAIGTSCDATLNYSSYSPVNSNDKVSITLPGKCVITMENIYDIVNSGAFHELTSLSSTTISPTPWVCYTPQSIYFEPHHIHLASILLNHRLGLKGITDEK